MSGMRSGRPRRRSLRQAVMVLAMMAQAVFALAAFADIHGIGASKHIEAAGINQHYVHNEATCVACAMAAIPLVASTPYTFVAPKPAPQIVRAAQYVPPSGTQHPHTTHSRAPPERR